jgi:hypothetical protein
MITIVFTALISKDLGYMRDKIDRELEIQLSKIINFKNGSETESSLIEMFETNNIDALNHTSDEWGVGLEDMKIIQKGIKWQKYNFFQRLLHINDGLSIYMRFHFTYKYSNIVLGFVYIGAAVLIIIVGLRGLKFIPVTQPSLVLFALSLEFSLLVTYAITIMYAKQDEEQESSHPLEQSLSLNSAGFGSSREIENFLRVFIQKNDKKDN